MWTAADMGDLTGKTAVVTGANSGIGYETARVLASKGAQVTMANRNVEKGEEAARQIRDVHPEAAIGAIRLDLADLSSIRAFVGSFNERSASLDVLCNNAGVMMLPERQETADGFEVQFGTNHLGHFALTGLLLDSLRKMPGARVITVSSLGHRQGRFDPDNLNAEKSYSPTGAYGLSKLANLLFTYELQRRVESAGIDMLSVASHPGWTETNLQRHVSLFRFLNRFVAQGIEMGALPTLLAATGPDVCGGDYYGPARFMEMRGYPKRVKSSAASHDEEIARKLWEASEVLTGIRFDF